ncbi:MAG: COX15/CtaA family protein [Verrucomicrobiota bacterium]|nr:COX15/CtaA family protein [Verrucomicrobiota bacterium]
MSEGSRAGELNRWLTRYAWLVAGATLLLIASGGLVTSHNAGLAVPDWPNTFGYNMFLFPISKWVGGIFYEHTHRLIASSVGFLTVILAVWLWLSRSRYRVLGILAVFAVILQGVLGGLRVTLLKDQIGIFHAGLAQAFLGLLVFIALAHTRFWRRLADGIGRPARSLRWIAIVTTLAIYGQLILGATMRHQHRDLSITDFPTAYRQWIPDTSVGALEKINHARDAIGMSDVTGGQIWLQMTHRFGAVLVALGVVIFLVKARRTPELRMLAVCWLVGLVAQITLGAWTIWSDKAADIATAHVAVGAIMLSLGVALSAIAWRLITKPHALDFKSRRLTSGAVPV